ncbi:JAB domain-containing protein [Segetibacter sp.]|nr:JAB domain-containing protein [Segetibacter sp.]
MNRLRKIKQARQLPDISLLDHVIVTTKGYYSFGEEGLL